MCKNDVFHLIEIMNWSTICNLEISLDHEHLVSKFKVLNIQKCLTNCGFPLD